MLLAKHLTEKYGRLIVTKSVTKYRAKDMQLRHIIVTKFGVLVENE